MPLARPLTAGRPSSRPSSRAPDGFYGWHVVACSAVALALTAPGQTAAVSAFVDPMIAELGISRSALSTAYLAGTLTGAAALPRVGRALDRYGVRRTMAVVGAVFGAVLLGLSAVTSLAGLTAGFVGIRLAGQGSLSLVATTAAALWFTRRRGLAVGVVGAVGSAGISLAPVGLERLIAVTDWRTAWAVEGLLVWAVVVPLALLGLRDRPADLGQWPDGEPPAPGESGGTWGVTRAEAMRTGFFWVVTAAVAVSGMLATALAFHQISLLGERGLTPVEAAANFLPQTAAGLGATLLTGVLVDRVSPRWLTSASMLGLATGLAWAVVVDPGWSAIGYGLVIGAAGGSVRALEGAAVPRYYGTRHVGSIRGFVAAVSVGSTAFGPVLFAVVHDLTGTYTPALLGSALLPLAVAAAAPVAGVPQAPVRPQAGAPPAGSGPAGPVPAGRDGGGRRPRRPASRAASRAAPGARPRR